LPEIIPSEPDLGNSSEGNAVIRTASLFQPSRFQLETAFLFVRVTSDRSIQSGRREIF
jgi:hypothetical protein